jgi:two-component system sensor histidine kinase ChvG
VSIRTDAPSTPSMGENVRTTKAARVEPNPPTASLLGRTHFSVLTRRIIFFNAFALLILIAGVLWVQSTGGGLVEERMAGIRDQAAIVGGALAEYAADSDRRNIDLSVAEPLLRQLIAPTRLRAQIYAPDGRLLADTRFLLSRNIVTSEELPPPDSANPLVAFYQRTRAAAQQIYSRFLNFRPFTQLEPYFEAGQDGRVYSEVVSALDGEEARAVRVNELGKLVLSVAVPIERLATHYGVLMLTTESGDIDDILAEERAAIIQVSLIAFGALLLSSLYLAGFIAAPIRRLAAAADHVRRGRAGREAIPTFNERHDEIGELAESLAAMTNALYDRINSTERFAADVAHELKNPLTSLKSAVDMLERTRESEARERMVALVRNDVKRIDRLITDISDASRLDAELSRAHIDPVDLSQMLETTVEIYNGMELPRGVRVDFHREPGENGVVQGIDERLGQVFRNLIDNAISFSPDGGVVDVSIRIAGPVVRAMVEDQGQGIPTADLERIFDRFFSSRPAETEFGKNSGLGLAIARQIISSHGGRIWADNRRDENRKKCGARFVVELPLARRRL